jgi:hypothetical protein|tara:strand:+ start:384 stop:491 length:108 start_codon:yes stop_codon:yes gene_type:complete
MEGFEIVHVTLVRTPPWREGLSVIDRLSMFADAVI